MFGNFFGGGQGSSLPEGWQILNSEQQFDLIDQTSQTKPVVIFKHSTKCPVSSMAMQRLVASYEQHKSAYDFFYLDLIANRAVSNKVEQRYHVVHQSPQILVIQNEKAVNNASHNEVDWETIVRG